jgi:hypothetical protein
VVVDGSLVVLDVDKSGGSETLHLVLLLLVTANVPASTVAAQAPCPDNPDPDTWHVRAGANVQVADGSRHRPVASFAVVERCAPTSATIRVLPGAGVYLEGGIRLKRGQRLIGEDLAQGGQRPRIRQVEGDGVTLADNNEVAGLHLQVTDGAGVFGDNVTGARLHDLVIDRHRAVPVARVDASLCSRILAGGKLDSSASVLRGCNLRLEPLQKAAIVLLADDRCGHGTIEHTIRNTVFHDHLDTEREALWSYGVVARVAGSAQMSVAIESTSLEGMVRGVVGLAYERSSLAIRLSNVSADNLVSDGLVVGTGFECSGVRHGDCAARQPVPESDARVALAVTGYRFADSRRRGRPGDAAAIETYAMDQGRSEIEIHVQDSDLIGAASPAFFTFYSRGRPARDLIDFGCVNPAPGNPSEMSEDRAACKAAGFTSPGRNRIFGNTLAGEWSSPVAEVALIGPGRMMAQGNFWGDRAPADGQGDTLGDCSRLITEATGDRPVRLVPEARCELYDVPEQGAPKGIDARFQLLLDPRAQ